MSNTLIKDSQELVGAKTRSGYTIPVYDNGYGPLWISHYSLGINGIVRAQKESEAYEICEDEFFPEADESWEEMEQEYSTQYLTGYELWIYDHSNDASLALWQINGWKAFNMLSDSDRITALFAIGRNIPYEGDIVDHPCWQEAYGFRPNGPNATDKLKHGIYAKDLNGDYLELLTPKLAAELEISIEINDTGEQYSSCNCCGEPLAVEFCLLGEWKDKDVSVTCKYCLADCSSTECIYKEFPNTKAYREISNEEAI